MIRRGQIYYVEQSAAAVETGCEIKKGRPAIIVSNDKGNEFSEVVEVVYLTTQPKRDLPTHVRIGSTKRLSTALCEQISNVSVSRLGDYVGSCTTAEMRNVDIALAISLGIDFDDFGGGEQPEEPEEPEDAEDAECVGCASDAADPGEIITELIQACAQRDAYKEMYERLLEATLQKQLRKEEGRKFRDY